MVRPCHFARSCVASGPRPHGIAQYHGLTSGRAAASTRTTDTHLPAAGVITSKHACQSNLSARAPPGCPENRPALRSPPATVPRRARRTAAWETRVPGSSMIQATEPAKYTPLRHRSAQMPHPARESDRLEDKSRVRSFNGIRVWAVRTSRVDAEGFDHHHSAAKRPAAPAPDVAGKARIVKTTPV